MWPLFQKRTTKWAVSHDLVIRFIKTLQMNVITFTTSNGGACEQAFCRVPSVDLGSMISKRKRGRGGVVTKIFPSQKLFHRLGRETHGILHYQWSPRVLEGWRGAGNSQVVSSWDQTIQTKWKSKKLELFVIFFSLKIFQFWFEIIIEGEIREKVDNKRDNGYDNVKIYVSIDEDLEVMGTIYVKEIQYTKGDGQVFNWLSKNYINILTRWWINWWDWRQHW